MFEQFFTNKKKDSLDMVGTRESRI
ncbi:hypothetical protein CMALT394_250081 [Carnobacterium maltaromaticum]|nr:hypothetical protein CMALT394_250081 [Carnobacterium maltaromaticum]